MARVKFLQKLAIPKEGGGKTVYNAGGEYEVDEKFAKEVCVVNRYVPAWVLAVPVEDDTEEVEETDPVTGAKKVTKKKRGK